MIKISEHIFKIQHIWCYVSKNFDYCSSKSMAVKSREREFNSNGPVIPTSLKICHSTIILQSQKNRGVPFP